MKEEGGCLTSLSIRKLVFEEWKKVEGWRRLRLKYFLNGIHLGNEISVCRVHISAV